ncbi:Membrane protein involved in the export of O-antigen and teichoic acid [Psychroflexus salarius]|uniref:Membrane protein involved in the export of O-antigen and teichoic acid n=1 Tax=Psychroflexus salarius TaxID=1155689 RepID=A0A1M4V568_9FLAO|nr:lipopolysaccharide biosynthesis protein [Psychroflexus salarius]SHE64070.1 Membrane protein involved in the export of O-antigen and teichoic acid [Psychroflexus salarius]
MLKQKALGGVAWSAVENLSSQVITFGVGIILARLLTPEEFGLIGMITIFIGISQVLINSGISDALIRKKNPDDDYYNTAFLFNAGVSITLYAVLYFTAPFIAEFYEKPILTDIIRLLSFTLIINALTLVQRAQVTKAINFKALAKLTLFSSLLSGGVAVVLAYLDYGVWSLVWKNIIASLLTLLAFWHLTKWLPSLRFDKESFKDMFGFGNKLMFLGLIDTAYKNMYFLIIGKYFSAADLGQYTRAETFKRLPSYTLTQIIQRVTYPVLSEIQDDDKRLKNAYQQILKATMLVSITGMFLLSFIAKDLTVVLMGQQWELAGEYLSILCFSGLFYPLDALNSNILKVKKQSGKILKIGIYRKFLAIPLIATLIFYGIEPFLYGLILYEFFCFLLISSYSKKLIDYSSVQQLKDISIILIINTVVYFFVFVNFSDIVVYSLIYKLAFYCFILTILLGVFFKKDILAFKAIIKDGKKKHS